MVIKADVNTDIGIRKKVNQDALLVKQAKTRNRGRVTFAVLCDGLGGLSCGEVASTSVITRMDDWFKMELPALLDDDNTTMELTDTRKSETSIWSRITVQWSSIVCEMNQKLKLYGKDNNISLGTTCICIFLMERKYLLMNIGDSRIYSFNDKQIKQLTHDQSYVQLQIDLGKMTLEQAKKSEKKNILLQCIGASENITPEFCKGECRTKAKYLLCSDGFWRKLRLHEIQQLYNKENDLKNLCELIKERGETDNISAICLSVE